MSKFFSHGRKSKPQGGLPSSGYFLEWAGLLAVLFLIVRLAGLKEFTSVLNGTIGSTNLDWKTASFLGAVYIFVYLGLVVLAPILILASLILKIWKRATATKGAADESRTNAEKS